jgi:hypothetical protein
MKRGTARDKSPIRRAKECGFDITLIEQNLRLTPTERLEKMISVQRFVEKVQSRKKRNNPTLSHR